MKTEHTKKKSGKKRWEKSQFLKVCFFVFHHFLRTNFFQKGHFHSDLLLSFRPKDKTTCPTAEEINKEKRRSRTIDSLNIELIINGAFGREKNHKTNYQN